MFDGTANIKILQVTISESFFFAYLNDDTFFLPLLSYNPSGHYRPNKPGKPFFPHFHLHTSKRLLLNNDNGHPLTAIQVERTGWQAHD